MTTRRNRGAPGAFAMLMLFVALTLAPVARAADAAAPADPAEGWRKAGSYTRCALLVYRAITPVDWVTAIIDCVQLFMSEVPPAGGGA